MADGAIGTHTLPMPIKPGSSSCCAPAGTESREPMSFPRPGAGGRPSAPRAEQEPYCPTTAFQPSAIFLIAAENAGKPLGKWIFP